MVDCNSFFLSGIENGEGQWNINILIINNIFELMIHFVSYLDMPRIKDQFHFFISRQHKITFTFYYLKNRKKSHFEYITLYLSSSTRLLTITCVFVLVAFNCFSVFILC